MGTPWSQMLSPGTPIFPFEATGGGLVCAALADYTCWSKFKITTITVSFPTVVLILA
jgi:hypothetical protein